MSDVVGTISACIDLAEKIVSLVQKFQEARKRIQAIANDVSLLQSILKQLKSVLKPDPTAGYTAVRLSNDGLKNSLTAVKRCEENFDMIQDQLAKASNDKRFKKKLQYGETISVDWAARTFWIFKESSVFELRSELNGSKQDVMLSLSVNQLYIAKQPSQ